MANICDQCSESFSKKSNLNRHLRLVHNQTIAFEQNIKSFKCLEGCNISFTFHRELISHLIELHAINIEIEEIEFLNIEDFYVYLNKLQALHDVEYVRARGMILNEDMEVFTMNCNRSGKSRLKNAEPYNQKRLQKFQGSRKINQNCTSQIKVRRNTSSMKVSITFHKTHYGHKTELQHLTVPKAERIAVAQKLASGITITRILDDNRENFQENKVKRMDMLTRKDIHNIKKAFNIEVRDGVRHTQDAVSVDLFVQECGMTENENNPILYYKAQGEQSINSRLSKDDFCLILMNSSQQQILTKFGNNIVAIDSTHGINASQPYWSLMNGERVFRELA